MPRVAIVIPNWNGMQHLPECFSALDAQSFSDFEVIVVDNASADESVDWLKRERPDVRLIEREDNGGFSIAVNVGIHLASPEVELIALLNNDTAAEPGWLAHLVAALDERPEYHSAASQMVLYSDPHIENAAGDTFDAFQMVGRNRGFGKPRERYTEPVRVFGACAGAALYRRSLFDDIGLFDESFFLNSEDTDINFRALLAGKKCVYVPGAVVRHKHRASIDTLPSWRMDRFSIRNEMAVVFKNYPPEFLSFAYVMWPYRTLRGVFPLNPRRWKLIGRNLKYLPDRFRAEAEGRRMGLSARRDIQALRTVSLGEVARWMLRGTGEL